tara:strand:+ start:18271 stop:18504 length:234 start_codon:yes stop_codon:yes gene_type:complete
MTKERVPFREIITFVELGKHQEKQIERLWVSDNQATGLINLLKYKCEDLLDIVQRQSREIADLKKRMDKVPFGGEIQ